MLLNLSYPVANIVERLLVSDIVYKQDTHRATVICCRNGPAQKRPIISLRISQHCNHSQPRKFFMKAHSTQDLYIQMKASLAETFLKVLISVIFALLST